MRSQHNHFNLVVSVAKRMLHLGAIAFLSLVLPEAATPSWAERQPDEQPNLGICGMYYLAGRAAIDTSGQLIRLEEYCQTYRVNVLAATSSVEDPNNLIFWQNFAAVATSEAIEFAQAQEPGAVLAYSATICPLILETGSLAAVRQSQSDGELPQSFEVAVTIASIYTYCPNYQSLLGR